MIERVTIEGYKSHRKTELELGRLTVLVGPNGSGKSSLLEALDHCLRCAAGPAEGEPDPLGGLDVSRLSRSAKVPFAATIGASKVEIPWLYSVAQSAEAPASGPVPLSADWEFGTRRSVEGSRPPTGLRVFIGASLLLDLDARALGAPRYCASTRARLDRDGRGLPNLVADMLLRADGSFDRLLAALTMVAPSLKNLRVRRAPVRQEPHVASPGEAMTLIGEELVFDFLGAHGVAAWDLSEGLLRSLGVLAALHGLEDLHLLLIDGVDRGLHPRAQLELVKLIKKKLERDPALQVVVTTHSPGMLDAVDPKSVWVLANRDDGTTACCRLSDHPKAERAFEVQTPGDFFLAHDEKWVVTREEGR